MCVFCRSYLKECVVVRLRELEVSLCSGRRRDGTFREAINGVVADQRGLKFWATENNLVEAEDMVQVNADQQK